jgi:rubredoxin
VNGHFFSGSFGGDAGKIGDATRLECKICWHVYDPAKGDDYWQIPPGTPFSQLPEHWTCPVCDAPKDGFMVLVDNGA